MFFRIDISKNYLEKLNNFETRQLMKPKTPNFRLSGTLRKRRVIRKHLYLVEKLKLTIF